MSCSCTETPAPTCVQAEALVGEDVVVTIQANDASVTPATPIDLSGYTFTAKALTKPGGTVTGTFAVSFGDDGEAILVLDTAGMAVGTHHFDVKAVDPGGLTLYFLKNSTLRLRAPATE